MLSHISSVINNNFATLLSLQYIDYRIDVYKSITDSLICRDINQFLYLLPLVDLNHTYHTNSLSTISNVDTMRRKLVMLCQSMAYIDPIPYLLPDEYSSTYIRNDIDTPTFDEVIKCMIEKYGSDTLCKLPVIPSRGNISQQIARRVKALLYKVDDITKLTLDELTNYCDYKVDKILPQNDVDYISKVFYANYKADRSYLSHLHLLLNNDVDIPLNIIKEVMSTHPYSPNSCYQQIAMYIEARDGDNIEVSTLLSYINSNYNNLMYRITSVLLPRMGTAARSVMITDIKIRDEKLYQLIIDSLDWYSQKLVMNTLRAQYITTKRYSYVINLFTIEKIALLTKISKEERQTLIDELLQDTLGVSIQIKSI